MKKYILLLAFISPLCFSEPFFGQDTTSETKEFITIKSSSDLHKCKTEKDKKISEQEIEKLTLIGLLNINGVFRALFTNDKNQIIDIKENELLNSGDIEIKSINLKSITYINWKETFSCEQIKKISIKL